MGNSIPQNEQVHKKYIKLLREAPSVEEFCDALEKYRNRFIKTYECLREAKVTYIENKFYDNAVNNCIAMHIRNSNIDVNKVYVKKNGESFVALKELYWRGKSLLIMLLLRVGADISHQDANGNVIFDWAVKNKNGELVKELIQHGVDFEDKMLRPLTRYSKKVGCIYENDIDMFCAIELLLHKRNINSDIELQDIYFDKNTFEMITENFCGKSLWYAGNFQIKSVFERLLCICSNVNDVGVVMHNGDVKILGTPVQRLLDNDEIYPEIFSYCNKYMAVIAKESHRSIDEIKIPVKLVPCQDYLLTVQHNHKYYDTIQMFRQHTNKCIDMINCSVGIKHLAIVVYDYCQ